MMDTSVANEGNAFHGVYSFTSSLKYAYIVKHVKHEQHYNEYA